ncbi:MAG: hypothetical protein UE068_00510 [Paludibacteraceae bacterium]|nr:hypothetical protein [Paludibacteraceae bacterium]
MDAFFILDFQREIFVHQYSCHGCFSRLGLAKGVEMPVMEEMEKRLRKING